MSNLRLLMSILHAKGALRPGTASLLLTGRQPSVEIASVRVPAAGSITLTGVAPSLRFGYIITGIGEDKLKIAGMIPSLRFDPIAVGAGALTFTGHVPTLDFPISVTATNDSQNHFRIGAPCYAGIRIDNDNNIYASNNVGTYSVHDSGYVQNGTTSEVWVERTINSSAGGGLTTDGIGASRVNCGTDRLLEIIDSSDDGSSRDANVTVRFYDAASGGTLLDTATYILSADLIGI